jgi:hypothetical protein
MEAHHDADVAMGRAIEVSIGLLGLAAAVYAAYAAWEASVPKVEISIQKERSWPSCHQVGQKSVTATVLRLNVANHGGRSTTLRQLETSGPREPPLLLTLEDNSKEAVYANTYFGTAVISVLDGDRSVLASGNWYPWQFGRAIGVRELNVTREIPLGIKNAGPISDPISLLNFDIDGGKGGTLFLLTETPTVGSSGAATKRVSLKLDAVFTSGDRTEFIYTFDVAISRNNQCAAEASGEGKAAPPLKGK